MKVLHINTTANVGSTGRIAEQIGLAVMERGGENYIGYGIGVNKTSNTNNAKSKVIRISSRTNYNYHRDLSKLTDMQGRFSTIATMLFIRKIKRIAPDIIHLHNLHGHYINYKILFKFLRKSNIPVVWTFHDCWPMTGHCVHFIYSNCDRWKSGCHDCPERKSYPKSLIFDRSRKNYIEKQAYFTSMKNLTIVPVSQWLGDIVKESYFKNNRIEVINNGIDTTTFAPIAESGLRELHGIPTNKKIVLGTATAWNRQKGFYDVLKLYDLLPKEQYQIVLVGLRPHNMSQIPEGVIGLPRTESVAELAQWYSIADVFVNLSYAETFGLTTAEALASGTPAVVYNNTANPQLITPTTGRVVEDRDIEAAAHAIEELCAEDREMLRKCCREHAVKHFDKNKCFEQYIALYESLV